MVSLIVIARLRTRLSAEDGFSLIELSVAMILSSMIAASLIAVFYSFSQNSGDLAARSNVQADARGVIAEQVVEIRQAIRADLNGDAVESLTAGSLVFYTQNYETGQIERVAYERRECVEGECELWVYRYGFESSDGITTTFYSTPYESSFLMGSVLSDQPIFVGVEYLGDPLAKIETTACDGSSTPCDFTVVGITLRARPHPTTGGSMTPVELHEEVRVRSA
jgi:prepilin-type N-terminal cleavage/methylation domain-containing protein